MAAPRVLLVGHGDFGRLYAEALRAAGALAGVAVRSEDSARALSSRLTEPVFAGYERALAALRPDAVAVLSPTHLHVAHARQAVDAKLPALVIKPAACAPGAAESLSAHAERAGVAVMVAHEGVFAPAFVALERAVRAGALGALREVGLLRAGPDRLSGGRVRRADDAGTNLGFTYATVMHDVYVLNRLAGRRAPESVRVVHAVPDPSAPELSAELHYPGGLRARVVHDGRAGSTFRRGLHVVGERASALWQVERGRTSLKLRRGREERDLPFAGGRGENPAAPVVEAFLRVLAGGAPEETLRDGALALRGAQEVTRAAAELLGVAPDLDAVAGGRDEGAP